MPLQTEMLEFAHSPGINSCRPLFHKWVFDAIQNPLPFCFSIDFPNEFSYF